MRAVWLLAAMFRGALASRALDSCSSSSLNAEDTTCARTAPGSTTEVGSHSLVQSMSFSRRISPGVVKEESAPVTAPVHTQTAAAHNPDPDSPDVVLLPARNATGGKSGINASSNRSVADDHDSLVEAAMAKIPVANSSRNESEADGQDAAAPQVVEMPVSKEAGMQVLMQLVKRGRMLATTQSLQASALSTAGLVIGAIVLITCLAMYVLSFHPELSRVWEASEKPSPRPVRTTSGSSSYVDPRIMLGQPRTSTLTPQMGTRTSIAMSSRQEGVSSSDEEDERAGEAQFCPDLVVPQHCECILLVPFNTSGAGAMSFDISDMNGSTVLRATTHNPGGSEHSLGAGLWRVFLTSAAGDALAQCREVRPSTSSAGPSGATEFHFLRNGGHYFAKLMARGQDRYELHTLAGKRLHFWGNFQARAVNVTDDSGRLLATTELHTESFEDAQRFRLRVAPLTDVGLALCGLLCINKLLMGHMV